MRKLCLLFVALCPLVMAQSPSRVSWLSILPGNGQDSARCIRQTGDGTVWVAGTTNSTIDFPGPNDPYQTRPAGGTDIFLARYQALPDGSSRLLYWTWFGGTADETLSAMEISPAGFIYLAGTTKSADMPTAGAALQVASGGLSDGFVAVFDPNAAAKSALVYASYFGGTGNEVVTALAVKDDGILAVAGWSDSTDLPNVTGNVQPGNRGLRDMFLVSVNPLVDGKANYTTYLGGDSTDEATAIAFDRNGSIWLAGVTASSNFPVTDSTTKRSLLDGFLVRLDTQKAGLDALAFSTLIGGGAGDFPSALRVPADGLVYLAGHTLSADFPVTAGPGLSGFVDAFVQVYETTGQVRFSRLVGGVGTEVVYALDVASNGRVVLGGYVMDGGFPVTSNAAQGSLASVFQEGFVAVINTQNGQLTYGSYLGGSGAESIHELRLGPTGEIYVAGSTQSSEWVAAAGATRGFIARIDGAL